MVKKQIYSIGFFLAAVLLAVSSLFLPIIFMNFSLMFSFIYLFVSVILACVLFAFSVKTSQSLWVVGVGIILAFFCSWVFFGSASFAVLFLILFVPAGAALGFGYRNKKILNDTVMGASVNAVILGLIAFAVLIGELSGGSFDVSEALGPVSESLKQYLIEIFSVEDPSLSMVFQLLEVSPKAFAIYLYSYIITNIPTFYMCIILLETVVGFWTIKFIMKRTTEQVSFMGRFSDCKISYIGSTFYIICNLCYILFSEYDFAAAFYNYSNIMKYVFTYAGVSLIAYFLEFKQLGNVAKNMILVAVIVISFTFPLFSSILSLLGLLDSGINFRSRIENSGV